ncbi:MAG: GNAT family N-acetyltransferase [Edaphobacter sp.]|uniref:GNAT family N-acetyltransferase n=1 Tax=Edaphobacter sp. TaxID=1934404 RepID=UPI00238B4BAE|nr:GNAT family N-acetyltransferase [Edaphobacter sp.]MDE1175351.1 GNAT family N-acetyltransferase [Edaphobacter sp.]
MHLAAVTADDLSEIVALINLAYRGRGDDAGWATENKYIEGERTTIGDLQKDLADRPQALFLMWRDESNDKLLGSVWLEPAKQGAWYLGLLNVRPDLQRRQLGRRLLEAAEERARAEGAERIRISVVNVRDQLIAWYQRRGYVLTGERQPFPYGDERFGRPLREDLEFVFLEKPV